jgi:putative GTP pyrophosphokinase
VDDERVAVDTRSEEFRAPAEEEAAATPEFEIEGHARDAAEEYASLRTVYEQFARTLESIVRAVLVDAGLRVHTLESRAKTVASFQVKAAQLEDGDPTAPKYPNPLTDITDLAGVRVIAFFLSDVERIRTLIPNQLAVLEEIDKAEALDEAETFVGYQSVHYTVQLKTNRIALPEYARFSGFIGEIQLRTIVQHAWAEIEHDIQYKSVESLPTSIRRRFAALAGLLAIADREFQSIQDEEGRLRRDARQSLKEGRLRQVEITADAVKAYLDNKLGPDGRMKKWAYDYTAKLLRRLGFTDFEQIEDVVSGLDDDELSRRLWGARQGQLTRFEDMLLAAMGHNYLKSLSYDQGYRLKRFDKAGIPLGNKTPATVGGATKATDAGP